MAILTENESHSFNRFLDHLDADIVGGADLVIRRSTGPGGPTPRPFVVAASAGPPAHPRLLSAPPGFHNLHGGPTPLPYPVSFASTSMGGSKLDREKEKQVRMAQQTRDLEQWMQVRSTDAPGTPDVITKERAYVPRPPTAHRVEDPTQSLEAMRDAEIRSGYAWRVAGGGGSSSSGGGRSGSTSDSGMPPQERPPPQHPKKPLETFRPPARKRKAASPPPLQTIHPEAITADPNPAPEATPSNIPPSPGGGGSVPRTAASASSYSRSSRPAPATATPSRRRPSPPSAAKKGALLSAAEKKANHIRSEQKRRAAIRSGYEGLCGVVPSLRAAVEEFEDRVKKASVGGRRKRVGGAGALTGGIDVGGEKVDGRAGPKSEAVVLGKTVEHVRSLLQSRQALLNRLSSAYAQAGEQGIHVQGGHRVWEDHWDEGPVPAGDDDLDDEDGDFSEDE